MKFQLILKNTGDIITVTDGKIFGLNEAKAYYIRMKQLKEKEFDMRLSQDDNGYYHLPINTENWQTLHKVSGLVMKNDYGVENFWVEWESNLYWYIGDTLGYIIKRNFNMDGQYVSYDTTYLTQFSGLEVSTSNQISYSNGKGEINNMIAPVKTMIGDTMKLTAMWYDGYTNFYIVLD